MQLQKGTNVVVFTQYRSIYFGTLAEDWDCTTPSLALSNARHGYALDTTNGVWQVVTDGPGKDAKVGPPVPTQVVLGVANVAIASETATKAWNEASWR